MIFICPGLFVDPCMKDTWWWFRGHSLSSISIAAYYLAARGLMDRLRKRLKPMRYRLYLVDGYVRKTLVGTITGQSEIIKSLKQIKLDKNLDLTKSRLFITKLFIDRFKIILNLFNIDPLTTM